MKHSEGAKTKRNRLKISLHRTFLDDSKPMFENQSIKKMKKFVFS
jgi:hypothetical protein